MASHSPRTQPLVRPVTHRSRGTRHGPITRLMSPGDLGEILKPFIFLDLFEAESMAGPGFPPHPHSGIATLTVFLEGHMRYADSSGKAGELVSGAVEWMRAGSGVWHSGEAADANPMRGYQLWLALPPELELADPESRYLDPSEVETIDGIRVILGEYDGRSSALRVPMPVTYLHVRLTDGQRWTYVPAVDHEVAFAAVNSGTLDVAGLALEREIAVFAPGNAPIEVVARGDAEFVVGSARRHSYPLVSGHYSVHTSAESLATGEANIAALGRSGIVASLQDHR
jgi:redox-sensitive bicupin YhaK (pirin superfamily)